MALSQRLIERVITVSLETLALVGELPPELEAGSSQDVPADPV